MRQVLRATTCDALRRDMHVISDDDPDPSLVMSDLWHHWQPVASLTARALYSPPDDVPQVPPQPSHPNPRPSHTTKIRLRASPLRRQLLGWGTVEKRGGRAA
jgi:hypothetical protein